jgi:hypothetical protein
MTHRCTNLRNRGNFRKVCAVVYWTVHVCTQIYLVRLCTENRCTDLRTTSRDQRLARFFWLKYAWVTFSRFVRLCTEPSMSTPKTYLVRLCTEPSMSTPKHILCGCVLTRCTDLRTTSRDQRLARFFWLKYAWVTFSRFVRLCTEPSMSTPKHILCGCVLNRCTDLRTPPGTGPLFLTKVRLSNFLKVCAVVYWTVHVYTQT